MVLACICSLLLYSDPDRQLLHLAEPLDGILRSDNQTLGERIPTTRLDTAGQLIHHVEQVRNKLATQRSDREAVRERCRKTQPVKIEFFLRFARNSAPDFSLFLTCHDCFWRSNKNHLMTHSTKTFA